MSTLLLLALSAADAAPGYLRYPDIHGQQVIFTAEDDLWIVDIGRAPSSARRLTRDEGSERHGRFSPDGRQIAYTADYDGNTEVFVMPAWGGEPRRLTWHPDRDELIDWTPDGRIIFRSTRASPHGDWELWVLDPDATVDAWRPPERLPLGWASRLAVDPETGMYAFNRLDRETRTWKRYRGGTAQDIWVGSPERADYRRLTDFEGTDAFPMWHGGRVWFLSDRGGTANIWSCTPEGDLCKRHTDNGDWDARWPAMGPGGQIVFMLAGDIILFDPESGVSHPLPINLPSDRDLTRARFSDPASYMTWASLSPDGDRVLYLTRGDIFSVPVEEGVTLPIAPGSAARESWASFSPDGERVLYVSDAGGEEAILSIDAWGRGEARTVVPAAGRGWHFPPIWAPGGERVAWSDDNQDLWVSPADGEGSPQRVDHSDEAEIRSYAWSPDGRWLAYTKWDRLGFGSVWIYDAQRGSTHRVTGPSTNDHSPAWDPEGRYLYFIGERYINPLLPASWRDFQYISGPAAQIYAVLLREDVENPLLHRAGAPPEEKSRREERREERAEEKAEKAEEEGEVPAVEIDLEGLEERTIGLPVTPGIYSDLQASADKVFFLQSPHRGMAEPGGDEGPQSSLIAYDLGEQESAVFAAGVSGYELAAGGDKLLLLRGGGSLSVVGASGPPGASGLEEGAVDLSGIALRIDPAEEWRQIFYEGWRHMRDFHWDQELRGLDWEAIRDQYASLLPRLATRDDLRDLMGELIGELATSHTYVWGGDYSRGAPWSSVGLLGADLELADGAWRVARIYRGDPADGLRSPLALPGVDIAEGDYILAVNSRPVDTSLPYPAALLGMADKPVLLAVNDRPELAGARQVVVTPTGSERALRYADWVRRNREYVAERTGGAVGYLHIPDMSTQGLVAFDRWFYAQLDKQGLVIDARWNGGGFVSQLMVERLQREVVHFGRSRGGAVYTYPERVLNGPFVVLTNEHAGSDGDIFPASIQRLGLAPVIGTRSWGGVIGIRADKRMTDGGGLTQPEYALWRTGDGWGIENHGVDPDIVVQDLPQELGRGEDAQLDRAIEEVLRLIEAHPPVIPEFGPAPDKSRAAFEDELD